MCASKKDFPWEADLTLEKQLSTIANKPDDFNWFGIGTLILWFHSVGNVMIPTDELIMS